jgi:hypothetical protein
MFQPGIQLYPNRQVMHPSQGNPPYYNPAITQPPHAAALHPFDPNQYAPYQYAHPVGVHTIDIQNTPKYTKSLVYRIISTLFFFAFTIAIFVLLGQSHSEDDKGACGKDLWPLVLIRLIVNGFEWLILFMMGVSEPPPGIFQKVITLFKLAFAIAFTVVLPAAVSSGCTQVSSNWYALVVISWIFLVLDWIAAVAGFIIALAAGVSRL